MKLIKFYKNPCVPCNMLQGYLDMIGVKPDESYKKDENLEKEEKYEIMSVPTLVLVDEDDNVIDKVSGVGQSKIDALLEKAGLI